MQENILIDDECHARLADFGSITVGEATTGRMTTAKDFAGTLQYTPPERLDPTTEEQRPTTAADVYAFGIVSYVVRHVSISLHNDTSECP